MSLRLSAFLFAITFVFLLRGPASAADTDPVHNEEQALRAAGLGTDGAALLDFFKKRTSAEASRDKLSTLVRQLGDKTPAVRDKAAGELVALGLIAIPVLRQASKDPDDLETANRARRCLESIEGTSGPAIPIAAARVLAVRKPAGAAEALLAYLPFADDDSVVDEVKATLAGLAYQSGKPDAALLKALGDKSSLLRAAAVEALCQPGNEEPSPAVRKLLQDPKPTVRLRAALALAESRDAKAIDALVALVGELPNVQGRQAEEYLLNLAGEQAPKVQLGNDEAARKKCSDAWAAWWKSTEGTAPLEEFRKRTLTDATREKAMGLIKQLGDEAFAVRERAQTDLQGMGVAILPLLHRSAHDADPEISNRSKKCLEALAKEKASSLSPVVVRLVALRKPAGAAETLLAYLPSADDEVIASEVQAALAAVAFRDGKPDPVLLKALQDKVGVRRAAAAEALCQIALERPRVRTMLKDADPAVRLKVALALANVQDKEAVPTLIALLAELPTDQGSQAETFLRQLAGDKGPGVTLGREDGSREKCRDAWAAWWKDNGAKVTLAKAPGVKRQLGYTMIVMVNASRIIEIGTDGKQRWAVEGLQYPWDAHMLPNDRILIAEYNGQRVTERNTKGEVLWEKRCQNPVSCQRLPNGNTFIAMRHQVIEVDRAGKEVFTHNRPNDIMAAYKMRDGQMVLLTSRQSLVRLDATGKEVKSFHVGYIPSWSVEVLPNGRVIVPQANLNKVVEYDPDGKVVWEASTIQYPTSAVRLPNGNTLVSSQSTMQVVELNRAGKVVWEYQDAISVFRARRR